MATFTLQRTIDAPPEVVFDIITDHRGYKAITPLRASDLEREGSPDPNGVGAIRSLRLAGPPMREEVTAFERPGHFTYKLLSGLPVRDHVGDVRIEPVAGGTRVTYRVDTTPTIPVVGGALVPVLRMVIKQTLGAVAKEAKRRAATA